MNRRRRQQEEEERQFRRGRLKNMTTAAVALTLTGLIFLVTGMGNSAAQLFVSMFLGLGITLGVFAIVGWIIEKRRE